MQAETKTVPTRLIPDSLNLIPDSLIPQPAVADVPAAPQEEPEEQPLEFKDMLHRYVRRKGLKKPNKPVLERAEEMWRQTAVGETVCVFALDGFCENDWWKTAKEPLLGFVKDPRSWMPRREAIGSAQRVSEHTNLVTMPIAAINAPTLAVDYPARWNELVPAKRVSWDAKRGAVEALRTAERDEVFVERFDEMCGVAQAIHERCGPEANWVTFEFAIRQSPKGLGWWRILEEFREMQPRNPQNPKSGQERVFDPLTMKAKNAAERAAIVAYIQAEADAEMLENNG